MSLYIVEMRTAGIFLFLLLSTAASARDAMPQRAAVFDFELIDTSLQGSMYGTSPAEKARLERLGHQLRKRLAESGRFEPVDISPVQAAAHASNLQACGACDADFAKKVGADLSITGTVQKVSDLILNVNLYVRDVPTGNITAVMSADMRGNTDESWSRTLDWLIRNRLLAPNFGQR
jgi:hypothetical protein